MIHKVNTVSSGNGWKSIAFVSNKYQLGDFKYTFKNFFGWCNFGKNEEDYWCKFSTSEFVWSDCWSENI